MEITVIASGSSGNCYRVSDGKTSLLLEAGIPVKKIKEGCGFLLPEACLVTHEHGDHAKYCAELMKCGVNIYATDGTAKAIGLSSHRLEIFKTTPGAVFIYDSVQIGTMRIYPFTVHHDAAEPVGYYIMSRATGERLLFMTDSYYIDYTFPKLTHIMIEANFSAEALSDDVRKHRLIRSHMSIENCVEMLKANDLSAVEEIWLLHLSSSNGDAEGFKRRVQETTGKPVFVA